MGYAGKVEERERARELRAQSWTLQEIATKLKVSKSSVSLWVRDVDFVPRWLVSNGCRSVVGGGW
jgi:hypothetical protein